MCIMGHDEVSGLTFKWIMGHAKCWAYEVIALWEAKFTLCVGELFYIDQIIHASMSWVELYIIDGNGPYIWGSVYCALFIRYLKFAKRHDLIRLVVLDHSNGRVALPGRHICYFVYHNLEMMRFTGLYYYKAPFRGMHRLTSRGNLASTRVVMARHGCCCASHRRVECSKLGVSNVGRRALAETLVHGHIDRPEPAFWMLISEKVTFQVHNLYMINNDSKNPIALRPLGHWKSENLFGVRIRHRAT